ncbi:stage II sporulation protein M [Aeribacillus sp. FSL M8-0254]|uniref:stage II sporulation protein M n=1 Tax=Aeribacillus sp. FSL M8-0254 TaxID=2954577 RepID=UPI0030FB65E1
MKTVLLRNKRVLSVAFIIYVIGIIMGTFFSNILPVERQEPNVGRTIFDYFIHNLLADVFISFTIFTFGIFTAALLLVNRFLVGVSIMHSLQHGNDLIYIVTALVPHGIFEIPAMIIAGSIGFKLIDAVIAKMRGESNSVFLKDIFTFFFLMIILTFIAAVVEAKITPYLMAQLS